jgi:thymidylate synthase (FAD)
MIVELLDHTPDAEATIARAAAVCYDSDTSPDALQRRVKHLMRMRHLSTLRFAYATFRIAGISRVTSHQLVRHPHLSFLQRSQRYVAEGASRCVMPPNWPVVLAGEFWGLHRRSKALYAKAIQLGVPKGDARYCLPEGTETEIIVSGNFQAWHDFLLRRTDKAAQWEIRGVAESIRLSLASIAPIVFGRCDE